MPATDFVRAYASARQTSSTNGTVNLPTSPATVVSGDELVLAIEVNQSAGTWTAPAGWTLVHGGVNGSAKQWIYRAQYGTDVTGSSWVFTNSAGSTWAYSIVALKGDVVGPFLTSNRGLVSGNPNSVNSGNITPAIQAYIVGLTLTRQAGGTPTSVPTTWPAGWTELDDEAGVVTSATLVASSCAAYDTIPAPAGTYSVTATNSAATVSGSQLTAIVAYEGGPPAFTASAALSGSGTLSAAGTPAVDRVAALGGSGTLSTTQTPAVARAAALSGSGTLSTVSAPAVSRAAALSGSGTLAAAGIVGYSRAAALGGDGTLSAQTFGFVTAALGGSGTLTAGQVMQVARAAALSGTGTLTAAQTLAVARTAALSGTGTLTAAQLLAVARAAALSGSGTLLAKVIYRLSWWTGSTWARVVSKVWTGTSWDPVVVTVVDD